MTKKTNPSTPISAHRHNDKRANIPTTELSDFIADDERAPKTVLYPRDPSLDPQLVWKGKDEQDRQDLAVPAVPVYIQEKIQPQAIIENVRAGAKAESSEGQLSLFADFNHIEFQDMVDFYHHEQNWSNRMILGDSLLVMTSLAEKEGLKGKVQMIYLDPPYGIKFGSNWQVSTRKRDVKDGRAEDATRQPEQVKAFRDTWELGIHSYLSYIRDRLVISRELLGESGSIFVQIGDENVHLVRCVLDEVFGSENFLGQIAYRKTSGLTSGFLAQNTDFILWYAKQKETLKFRQPYSEKGIDSDLGFYSYLQSEDGSRSKRADGDQKSGEPYSVGDLTSSHFYSDGTEPFVFEGKKYTPGFRYWTTSPTGMRRLSYARRIHVSENSIRYVRLFSDFPVQPLTTNWTDTITGQYSDPRIYVVQTNAKVIQRCILMTTDPGDLVLDPTCGSGTTAYVAEQWGRRWITIDTSRVAVALARTRLMAGRFPYYLLADTPEGMLKEAEASGQVPAGMQSSGGDIKRGFVYRRVPHITLKSIANNEEIDAIHARWQPELDRVRGEINRLEGKDWEEWEVPAITIDATAGGSALTPNPSPGGRGEPLGEREKWWQMRRERQAEIDASIARRADTELLYDQPYEDSKRVRVSGPFTVESLSPHRVLSTDAALPASEEEGKEAAGPGQFATMILQNLKTAGVQNTNKSERLKFTRLEPYAGVWLQAVGEYSEKDGSARRAAVCIGPEHGTVGPDLIKDAAKEAVRGVGFDLLIVCGFAFDPFVTEEVKNYGRLTVLPVRMNPDLAMGDELLKKTGAGNLFMVFGEPDIEIQRLADGKLAVKLNGVDVYDPTTGEIRSSSTDDIACWMIDTDYNEESFFVRHAYFTGADEPYEKLKRALRAEIDEGAWSQLYATTSMPFERPARGKIAVKVINHYGDEVLKVYEVR